MIVACCQIAPQVAEPLANRDLTERSIRCAADLGAQLVVLPELAASGYVFTDVGEAHDTAEPLDGPAVTSWVALAEELSLVVVGGMCELGADGLLYNTAVIIDSTGVRARYRKVHLWDREKLYFTPGVDAPPIVEMHGARIAVMVCYDLEFPEWVRCPALAGAQLLCAPVNWPYFSRPPGERPMEVVRTQAAASNNRIFIAAADRIGAERGVDWVGGSVVVDPDGWPLAGPVLDQGEHILIAECRLELADDKSISERNNVRADRMPRLYEAVMKVSEGA